MPDNMWCLDARGASHLHALPPWRPLGDVVLAQLLSPLLLAASVFGWGSGVKIYGPRAYVPVVEASREGGAYIAWNDDRDPYGPTYDDAFMQRMTSTGAVAAGWPATGAVVSNTIWNEVPTGMVVEGDGSCLVSWYMRRNGTGTDVFLQHVEPTGQLDPLWPAGGVTVAADWCDEDDTQICSDGAGGAFVAWEEYRYSAGPDIRARRVLASGTLAPAWPDTGVLVGHTPGSDLLCNLVADGSGGAYVAWWGSNRAYVQHLTAAGAIAPGWPEGGLRVCPLETSQFVLQAVSDEAGGVVVAWDDNRETPAGGGSGIYGDIFAMRLQPDGTRAPGWPVDGLPVCVQPGAQWDARLCPDGTGGAVIAWSNRQLPAGMGVQRILGTGAVAPGWPVNGIVVGADSTSGSNPKVASDGHGGAYLAWYSDDLSWWRVWAMHVLGDGSIASGWSLPAVQLMPDLSSQQDVNITATTDFGAVVVWRRSSGDVVNDGVWAQKLVDDGVVATQLALRDVQATAGSVVLTWSGARAAGAALAVERSDDGTAWTRLGEPQPQGAEALRYEDTQVVPGSRYAYRLTDANGVAVTVATWVEVPAAARFTLAGARPNPARAGAVDVAFSLSDRAPGTLELLDVTGRRVATHDLGALAPGAHVVRMAEGTALRPGVYWLRLAQAGHVATARVAVVQ